MESERIPLTPDELFWLALIALALLGIPALWSRWKDSG